jgi:TonB family protein
VPLQSQPLTPPTSAISPVAPKNLADHTLRRRAGACAFFASRVSSRGCAQCNVAHRRHTLADAEGSLRRGAACCARFSVTDQRDASANARSPWSPRCSGSTAQPPSENLADHPLRRRAGACAFFASRVLSRGCARCNIGDQRHSLAHPRSVSALPEVFLDVAPSSKSFLPGSAQNVECDVTHSKQTIGGFLPGARTRQRRARTSIAQLLSNRELQLLEPTLTHRKQTVAPRPNRELSTNPCFSNSDLRSFFTSRSLVLTQEGPLTTSHRFKSAAASALIASHPFGYNATHMPTGSQGTQRAPITPPSSELQPSMDELPVHSRLPRLDLGVDWESPWEEFRSSVRDFFHGPRAPENADAPQDSDLRVQWIEGQLPRRAFAASFIWHVIVVAILLLPIWGFLANAEPSLAMPRIELTYVPTQDLHPISLPGNHPKPSPTGNPAKPLPRSGADAFHPRQTILSQPLKITHPRQTLIQPNAPAAPPKMVPQMPNIAEWAATSPEPAKPQLRIAPSVVAPQVHQRSVNNTAAPDVANPERNAGPLNIAPSPVANAQPKMPVNPMSTSAPERRNTHADASAAPVIGPTASAGDESLHRLIAISATPAPPAPEVSVPQGNLSARVAISPDGTRAGAPGGSANGAPGNGGSGGSAASVGGAGANSGANANLGPAGVSISGGNGHAGIGTAGNHSGGLILKPMSKVPTLPDPSRKEPIVVAKIDPSLPPEKILSGKEIFTMHVDMPNLTSASGSWILNFAQLDDNLPVYERPKGKLSGPVALRKVDPKYPQSAIKQRIDGEVILYAIIRKDGHVDSIQLVRGIDPLLDQNAMEALARWEFRPATREGQPVDLEAVIHIPFHFNPPE